MDKKPEVISTVTLSDFPATLWRRVREYSRASGLRIYRIAQDAFTEYLDRREK